MDKSGLFVVDDLVGISLLTATAYKKNKEKYLLVTPNLYKAQKVFSFMKSLLPEERIYLFPADELIRAENISQSKEMAANRIYVLNEIINNRADIVICNLASLLRFLPDVSVFKSNCLKLKVGEEISLEEIKKTLIRAGYTKVNKIDASLQFAVRGDIIDIFSVNYDDPIRIELFGDEIESIRTFDIASQTSKEQIQEIDILPANDFLLTEQERKEAGERRALLAKLESLDTETLKKLLENA